MEILETVIDIVGDVVYEIVTMFKERKALRKHQEEVDKVMDELMQEPWTCKYCYTSNAAGKEICDCCSNERRAI